MTTERYGIFNVRTLNLGACRTHEGESGGGVGGGRGGEGVRRSQTTELHPPSRFAHTATTVADIAIVVL